MSGFTAIEGRVLGMGTVSGTDETPISLYEPTHAIRIFLENPVTVNNAPVYLTGVTSINTTASGLVDIVGDGATSVTTLGNVITVSSPFPGSSALVGNGGTTIISGTNTTLVSSQIDKALVGTDGITIVSGSNTVTIQGFRTEFVAASGFLQAQITAADLDVSSLNSLTGAVTLAEGTNITITPAGNTLTIASTAAGGGASHALIGTGGITITSGTNTVQISSQVDKAWVGAGSATVISGANLNILSAGVSNAILGSGGITVISGANTTSISSAAPTSAIIGDSFISVNSGTNTIRLAADAILGTANNIVVVSGSSSVTASGMVTVISGIAYNVDTTRGSKSLSVSRQNYPFSFDGLADGTFLAAGTAVNADAGWVMPRNGTIVSWAAYFTTGPAGKTFEVRKNNSATTLATLSVNAGAVFYNDQVNIDVNKGDRLQVFVTTAGLGAQDPSFMIEVSWRLS